MVSRSRKAGKNPFVSILLIIIVIAFIMWAINFLLFLPPQIYKGVTRGGWEVTYILAENNDDESRASYIGQIQLKNSGQCPYINDIVYVLSQIDWGMIEPAVTEGYLDIKSGHIYGKDGNWIITEFYRTDNAYKLRELEYQITFKLKDGRDVTERVDLRLQNKLQK